MAMEQSAVVVGGGMVGAATACALQLQGIPVTLIDPYPPVLDEALPSEYAIRVSALTLASKHILQSLGAWDYITAARLQPFQQMHVWDAQGNGEIHFHGDDISQPYLGYLVENFVVQKALWQRLQQLSVCTIKASVESISPLGSKGEHRLVLDDGAELRASLVIAADGANSPLRKMLGIEMAQHDYQHTAIVATVKPELSHDNTAW
ncbi:MAG: 2-octaprenyl-3-methyl-6-methoxy-1,4-benzoquinol hydroxylase, partial [Methylococcales bacterium]|nr:2-octaprenyl-3-methyl-6-methoxy-1,4-benzoquinol hydroxylase [Methylococcales bacterium]